MNTRSIFMVVALAPSGASLVGCGPPKLITPVEDFPKLGALKLVMRNLATSMDPLFGIRDRETFTAEEFAAMTREAPRVSAAAAKSKDFSMGSEFDAHAARLGEQSVALGQAAQASDAAAARKSLGEMKGTCGACHSEFR